MTYPVCPECGGAIEAWADLDATLTCSVGKNGKLKAPVIENALQSDGRAGVDCSECGWQIHAQDDYPKEFEAIIAEVFDIQESTMRLKKI